MNVDAKVVEVLNKLSKVIAKMDQKLDGDKLVKPSDHFSATDEDRPSDDVKEREEDENKLKPFDYGVQFGHGFIQAMIDDASMIMNAFPALGVVASGAHDNTKASDGGIFGMMKRMLSPFLVLGAVIVLLAIAFMMFGKDVDWNAIIKSLALVGSVMIFLAIIAKQVRGSGDDLLMMALSLALFLGLLWVAEIVASKISIKGIGLIFGIVIALAGIMWLLGKIGGRAAQATIAISSIMIFVLSLVGVILAMWLIDKILDEQIIRSFALAVGIFIALGVVMIAIGLVSGFVTAALPAVAVMLLGILSVMLIAIALKMLIDLPFTDILYALGVLVLSVVAISLLFAAIQFAIPFIIAGIAGALLMGIALIALASGLKLVSELDPDSLISSIKALGGVMWDLGKFFLLMALITPLATIALIGALAISATMLILAASLNLVSGAFEDLEFGSLHKVARDIMLAMILLSATAPFAILATVAAIAIGAALLALGTSMVIGGGAILVGFHIISMVLQTFLKLIRGLRKVVDVVVGIMREVVDLILDAFKTIGNVIQSTFKVVSRSIKLITGALKELHTIPIGHIATLTGELAALLGISTLGKFAASIKSIIYGAREAVFAAYDAIKSAGKSIFKFFDKFRREGKSKYRNMFNSLAPSTHVLGYLHVMRVRLDAIKTSLNDINSMRDISASITHTLKLDTVETNNILKSMKSLDAKRNELLIKQLNLMEDMKEAISRVSIGSGGSKQVNNNSNGSLRGAPTSSSGAVQASRADFNSGYLSNG